MNTAEIFFSILRRGLIGAFHNVGSPHYCRYFSEFDFGHNNRNVADTERMQIAFASIAGTGLVYRDSRR